MVWKNPNLPTSEERIIHPYTIPAHLVENPALAEIWKRNHQEGFDIKLAVCADSSAGSQTRVGKSTLALRLAQVLDVNYRGVSRFKVDRVVFNWEEFKVILQENLPRGSVIILEEAQTWFNSRNFNSKANKDIIDKLSTAGVFGYIFIFTYPQFETIDTQVRQLIHYEFRILKKDLTHREIHYMPHTCMPGYSIRDPIYRMPFQVYEDGHRKIFIGRSPLPHPLLIRDYELKALPFKEEVKRRTKYSMVGSKVVSNDGVLSPVAEARARRLKEAQLMADRVLEVASVDPSRFRSRSSDWAVTKIASFLNIATSAAYYVKEAIHNRLNADSSSLNDLERQVISQQYERP